MIRSFDPEFLIRSFKKCSGVLKNIRSFQKLSGGARVKSLLRHRKYSPEVEFMTSYLQTGSEIVPNIGV